MKKVAIIWANPYNSNMGVAALAYSALALICDVLEESQEAYEITFIGSNTTKKDSINIGKKKYEFNNLESLDYLKLKSIVKLLLQYKKYNLFKVLSNDYILDIGEGDSFADIYGKERFNRIVNSKRIFNFFRRKQMLLPQTVGPFKDSILEKKAIQAIKSFDSIYVRDKQSYDYTRALLSDRNINESIDVAFYLPFEKTVYDKSKIHIGINVSGLLWNGGYTKNDQFGLKTDYQVLIRNVIEYFITKGNCQIHLVPHVIPIVDHVENDRTISEEILKEYPDVIIAPRFNSPIEAKSYISGLDFFTGARMHSTIAAFSSGVPVVPMAYSRKFNGLFNETLKYKYMSDLVNEDTEIAFNNIIEGYENRDKLRDNVRNSLTEIVLPRLNRLKEELAVFFNS